MDLIKSWSGNVDSLVVDENNAQFILGGEWTLSIEDGKVTDFNADIDMTPADGDGSAFFSIYDVNLNLLQLAFVYSCSGYLCPSGMAFVHLCLSAFYPRLDLYS